MTINITLQQRLILEAIQDRSWHDPIYENIKDLMLGAANEIERLTADRDAAFAAGFEAARDAALELPSRRERLGGQTYAYARKEEIRALSPSDASEALAARDRKMRAEGMRKAADLFKHPEAVMVRDRILAAADKEENPDE